MSARPQASSGIALISVLIALTLLLLLALPFALGMGAGLEVATNTVDQRTAEVASASARELMLAEVAFGHAAFDPTRTFDGLDEFPHSLELPGKLAGLREDGRVLLSGEVWDQQRHIDLRSISPLVLMNLIGTVSYLQEDLEPEAAQIVLDDGGNLPASGYVFVDWELIRYGHREGNILSDLQRSVHGRQDGVMFALSTDRTVKRDALVFDWRCVLAASAPFDRRGGRSKLVPYAAVGELAEIARSGEGSFTRAELDTFELALTVASGTNTAPQWGRAERVFEALLAPNDRVLRVKSAVHLGAGSTVRLRNVRTGVAEYNIVITAATPRGRHEIALPSEYQLGLLLPVTQEFPAIDTVVEPLIPPPVNINTAAPEVIAALCAGIRRAIDVRTHDGNGTSRQRPSPPISRSEARAFADDVVQLRSGGEHGAPLQGFEDFATRLFKPRFAESTSDAAKRRWTLLYRALLTGRDSEFDMSTAPICFCSGPRVGYRAAAAVARSTLAPMTSARMERTGVALALPGTPLEDSWDTQELLEEAFRLDQRAAYYLTWPVNTGAVGPFDSGNPPSRWVPHVAAMAFPDAGLGQPRFPSRDTADSGLMLAPASALPGAWAAEIHESDSFSLAIDPRGRDIGREGAYRMRNTGQHAPGGKVATTTTHDRISFPFAQEGGVVSRFGTSFWVEPESWGNQVLFDHGTSDRQRNRISLEVKDGNLVLEVLDEAGLDPQPNLVPTTPPRTAAQWTLPIAELGAPAKTAVHFNVAAYGNRADDLSVLVDGFPRGKRKFVTHLSAAVPVYDPQNPPPGPQVGTGPRYLDLQVDSVENLPSSGIVRIGTELFEYTGIQGNTLRCQFRDSYGGRMARQTGREFRPDIPVDANGKPTINIDTLPAGIIDVAPDHAVGSEVELYGYSLPLSSDSVMHVLSTATVGSLGGFTVARAWLRNARGIDVPLPTPPGGSISIGTGITDTSTDDIELADPIVTSNYPPNPASAEIAASFAQNGGYALLVQTTQFAQAQLGVGQNTGTMTLIGGVEAIQYTARQGTKLTGIRRNVRLPGNNAIVNRDVYDGTPRRFVCDWDRGMVWPPPAGGGGGAGRPYSQIPQFQSFIVPISLPVQDTSNLADPATTFNSEWVQLYQENNDNDTEWVRYDAIQDSRHLMRTNRAAWGQLHRMLTGQIGTINVNLNRNGGTVTGSIDENTWGVVVPTSGYIGYTPQLESTYPQIHAARLALGFRGDPFTRTSSHPQANSLVLPCHRMRLFWGNYAAFTGRPGRLDRICLIEGSQATGDSRPAIEWHTVQWSVQRFGSDVRPNGGIVAEPLGVEPFQLVAFRDRVAQLFMGVPQGQVIREPRLVDRMVKFPSGELPAAYATDVFVGGAVGNSDIMRGIVDEVHVTRQLAEDLLLSEPCDSSAREFRVRPDRIVLAHGEWAQNGAAAFPRGGGLVQIDEEIVAFQDQADGVFRVASNGRGMLGTDIKGHDKGGRVHFLTHVPAAILMSQLQAQGDVVRVQALGALSPFAGALLAGNEVLLYAWVRHAGDNVSLEMPRLFPPDDQESRAARGLFRGRYGTAPQAFGQGQAVVAFPIRYWDRHVERSEDPEQACFQLTVDSGSVFFKSITWKQETNDVNVDVECLLRIDQKAAWTADPEHTPALWRIHRTAGDDHPTPLGWQGAMLEARFVTIYKAGCLDTVTHRAHAYKTAPRVKDVRVEYEGQGQILCEQVTAR